jgi:tetratricopeptide (TPR) repeat protein
MRGFSDRQDFQDFVTAVLGFPPTARNGHSAKEVFHASYEILDRLAGKKIPRVLGWKAYALALSVYENWGKPRGAPSDPGDRLVQAKSLAEQAIDADPTDFDVHWAMADVCLIRYGFLTDENELEEAEAERTRVEKEFDEALTLNADERHPNLFAEAASAMMQIGEYERADKLFRKAERRPDWHRWMRGIDLFLRAGRADSDEESSLLEAALTELKSASRHPEEDFYQEEIQLVLAAIYWRKHELGEGERTDMQLSSERNRRAAEGTIRKFRERRTGWKRKDAQSSLALAGPDRKYWRDTIDALWDLSGGDPRPTGKRGRGARKGGGKGGQGRRGRR